MYYTCPRRLGTIRSSLARGMRHRHMMLLNPRRCVRCQTPDAPLPRLASSRVRQRLGVRRSHAYRRKARNELFAAVPLPEPAGELAGVPTGEELAESSSPELPLKARERAVRGRSRATPHRERHASTRPHDLASEAKCSTLHPHKASRSRKPRLVALTDCSPCVMPPQKP